MEAFVTLQGEGHHQGKLAFFIRLAGCDVGCSWCDVKESWEIKEEQWRDVDDIVREAIGSAAPIVVITGGEALMHNLTGLTKKLRNAGLRVHLETSGAYALTGEYDWICLSPKKFKKALDEFYALADEIKIIVVNAHDLTWAKVEAAKTGPDCLKFLQAEWEKRDESYALIYSYIVENPDWRISIQSHKYLGLP